MAAASEIVSVGSMRADEQVGLAFDFALQMVANVARGAGQLAGLLADDHQLADDRRKRVAVAFELAAEFFAAADGDLQIADALLDGPIADGLGRLAQRLGQRVARRPSSCPALPSVAARRCRAASCRRPDIRRIAASIL